MAPLLRLKAMVLSLSILCGWVSSGIGKIAPADRPGMRRITVVEKQTSISPAFSLPSHPVSGALSGGLAGVGTGAHAGIAMCPIGPCAFGMGGFGAVLGLVSGIAIGAACGSAIAEAEIDDPAAQVKRLFETVEVKRFRAAIEARIQYLKPNPVDSMAPSVPDTVLEVTEISITIRQANREPDDSSSCPPGLSGTAKWRALGYADNKLLGEVVTNSSRRATSKTFKDWLHSENEMRADMELLLDDLGMAIADDLLIEKTARP